MLEFRLRYLKDPRARAVIEAAAQRAGWRPNANGDGVRGRGFAFAKYKNLACYCATVADVEVDRKTGLVRVARVVAAVDAGQFVNPDGVINQIEGGIIQSTSWTLKESVRFDRTRVTTRSWADYPILRFAEVPGGRGRPARSVQRTLSRCRRRRARPDGRRDRQCPCECHRQAAARVAVHARAREARSGLSGPDGAAADLPRGT